MNDINLQIDRFIKIFKYKHTYFGIFILFTNFLFLTLLVGDTISVLKIIVILYFGMQMIWLITRYFYKRNGNLSLLLDVFCVTTPYSLFTVLVNTKNTLSKRFRVLDLYTLLIDDTDSTEKNNFVLISDIESTNSMIKSLKKNVINRIVTLSLLCFVLVGLFLIAIYLLISKQIYETDIIIFLMILRIVIQIIYSMAYDYYHIYRSSIENKYFTAYLLSLKYSFSIKNSLFTDLDKYNINLLIQHYLNEYLFNIPVLLELRKKGYS